MLKAKTFLFGVISAFFILSTNCFLYAQTKKTTLPDTTKKATQKLQRKQDLPKLELPDVIIYGTDRAIRVSGDKLNRPDEDIKLVAPKINYQPLTKDLQLQNHKGYFQSQQRSIHSKTMLQLDAGRYQQLNIEASRWNEAEQYNYSVQASYERSNGQFKNSQYYQGSIKGQLGICLSPNFIISSRGKFRLFDYGLYGAQFENLQRKTSDGKLKIDAQWSISAEQSANFSVYLQQNNCKDNNASNYQSKLITRNIGLISLYQTKYRSIPFFIRGLYEYQKLNKVTLDAINSQQYIQIKSWSSFKIKKFLIIKPGILFENLDLSDSFSAYQFSPDVEMIVTPIRKLGIVLRGTRGYYPFHYTDLCERNSFVCHKINFIPITKELELKLGIEYHPSSTVSLTGEVTRQNWRNYAFWSREEETGLFQLTSLNKAILTIINFQSRFTISPKLNFNAGIQINFDTIKSDSLAINDNHLPYLQRLILPFNFEYKINESMKTLLSFLWIGPRYLDLTNDEQLSTFGLLSLYFEKQFHKNISVFVEGNNLLNQKYEFWQHYPAMGLYFEAGLKGSW